MLNNKTIMIIGATGSFGQKFTKLILKKFNPKKSFVTAGMKQSNLRWQMILF